MISVEHLMEIHDRMDSGEELDNIIESVYQQGREDVLREHREQCQGKCFKCDVSVPFINSDGEEVILPYSYSYKTDCEDNRYINAKEVLGFIKQARVDAISEFLNELKNYTLLEEHETILEIVAEQLKENKNDL